MAKFTIPLKEFFKYAGIDYKEDMWGYIYNEWQKYNAKDIVQDLPKKYSHFTKEVIEENNELHEALNNALNKAYDSAYHNAGYDAQLKAVESYKEDMITYINQINEKGEAINAINIDWSEENVEVNFNPIPACQTIMEIIEGEGVFCYNEDVKEFVQSYDGSLNYEQAVEHHAHYLLNVKLINDIYGMTGKPKWEWEVNYAEVDEDCFGEYIEEELGEIEENAKKKIEKITKDLNNIPKE